MGACFNERGRTASGLGVGASEHVKAHRELENAREFVKTAWSQLGALPPRSNKNAMKRQLMHELLSAASREDHTTWNSEYWQQVKRVSKTIWEPIPNGAPLPPNSTPLALGSQWSGA